MKDQIVCVCVLVSYKFNVSCVFHQLNVFFDKNQRASTVIGKIQLLRLTGDRPHGGAVSHGYRLHAPHGKHFA